MHSCSTAYNCQHDYVCFPPQSLPLHVPIVCACGCVAVKEISDLLNTGLDDETLKVCVQLLEAGVNPEALATVVRELRRETAALRVRSSREGGSGKHNYFFI